MKPSLDIRRWKVLVKVDIKQAASEFGELTQDVAERFVETLGIGYMVQVVSQLGTDAAAEFLQPLSAETRNLILNGLSAEKAADLREILSYPAGTVGALMAKEFFSIPVDFTIREATAYLQTLPQERKGAISYIYAVDKDRRLEGVLQMRDLLLHAPDTKIGKILKSPVLQVETGMPQLYAAQILRKHHYLGIPVVDREQRLVGVVRADNVIKVFQREADDDIARLIGTSPEEMKTTSIRKIIAARLPWFFVSIASGLLCAFISGLFRNSLGAIVTLFLFVPIVLGLSESTGVQAATIMVRNIVLGLTAFKNLWLFLAREAAVGVSIGIVCGIIVGMLASAWHESAILGIALASSMTVAIMFSALIGLLMPLLFKELKLDPTLATGPLVLAICDIQTLFVYFTLSIAIMR